MEINKEDVSKELMGMNEIEAEEFLYKRKIASRILSRNGEGFMLSQDFNPDRANLTIEYNKVVGVSFK